MSALPAAVATDSPARSLPVIVTAATRASAMIDAAASRVTSSVSNSPAGPPAAATARCSSSAQPVTFSACLSTTVLPSSTAGASTRTTCQYGKFHGMIANSTPSGSSRISSPAFGPGVDASSATRSAYHSQQVAHFSTSARDAVIALPISSVAVIASGSACVRIAAAMRRSTAALSLGKLRRQWR